MYDTFDETEKTVILIDIFYPENCNKVTEVIIRCYDKLKGPDWYLPL